MNTYQHKNEYAYTHTKVVQILKKLLMNEQTKQQKDRKTMITCLA